MIQQITRPLGSWLRKWLRQRWTMDNGDSGRYEAFYTCRGDRFLSLTQSPWRTLMYRGIWAAPYAGLLAFRRRRRFHGSLQAWSFAGLDRGL